jgi:hypothetical protein
MNYAIDDGDGNRITTGLSEERAYIVAQRLANERKAPVYVYETGEHEAEAEAIEVKPHAAPKQRPCPCHSGKPGRSLYDARGIFVAVVCDECEATVKARYRPEIFSEFRYETDEPIEEDL